MRAPNAEAVRRAMDAVDGRTRDHMGVTFKDGEVDLTTGPGWIYIIVSGDGLTVKIGWAKNPHRRVAVLQTGHPGTLTYLGVVPGHRTDEAALHRAFHRYRIHGEWFEYAPIKDVLVRLVKQRGYAPKAEIQKKSRTIPELRLTRKAAALKKYKELGIL